MTLSDIDTATVDSLKVLDPERPIREADIAHRRGGLHSFSFLALVARTAILRPFHKIRASTLTLVNQALNRSLSVLRLGHRLSAAV